MHSPKVRPQYRLNLHPIREDGLHSVRPGRTDARHGERLYIGLDKADIVIQNRLSGRSSAAWFDAVTYTPSTFLVCPTAHQRQPLTTWTRRVLFAIYRSGASYLKVRAKAHSTLTLRRRHGKHAFRIRSCGGWLGVGSCHRQSKAAVSHREHFGLAPSHVTCTSRSQHRSECSLSAMQLIRGADLLELTGEAALGRERVRVHAYYSRGAVSER